MLAASRGASGLPSFFLGLGACCRSGAATVSLIRPQTACNSSIEVKSRAEIANFAGKRASSFNRLRDAELSSGLRPSGCGYRSRETKLRGSELSGAANHYWVLDDVLAMIGLRAEDAGGKIEIIGEDPVVSSRHRVGRAAACALAAQGVALAAIWKARTGRGQDIAVDLRQAVIPGLRTCYHVYQHGHLVEQMANFPYPQEFFFKSRDDKWMLIYHYLCSGSIHNVLGILDLLKCSHHPDDMARAVREWDALELEAALAERKLVGLMCRTREEWLAHPQGQWLATQRPVEIEKYRESAPIALPNGPRPLSGLRVLDFAHVLAGPVTSKVLAEQGADVLRIMGPRHRDDWLDTIDTSAGKRLADLDLDVPADVELAKDLVRSADVFVQSWRPGSLAARGFSPEELFQINPGLIYVSISAYGSDGPWATRGGYNPVGMAACGLAFEEGSPDKPDRMKVVPLNDYLTPYLAAAGVLGAVIKRAREGGAYHVKASLTRTSMWVQELGILPEAEWPDSGLTAEPRASDMLTLESPCGTVTLPAPIVQYSETKAYWDKGPEPFGASRAEWLPR